MSLIIWGDDTDCHPDGSLCPFFAIDQPRTAASVRASEGIYHGDGTRCPLWTFTQPRSEPGDTDSSPTVRPRRTSASKTPNNTTPATAPSSRPSVFDVQTLSIMRSTSPLIPFPIPTVHPNLHKVLLKILTPNITPIWLATSLIPFLTTIYGSSLANHNLDCNVWPEAIENADLLIQAMGRAAQDKDFSQKYYTALMGRIDPLQSVERDEFCEKLAWQSADFAIFMWCMLESREAGSLVWEGDGSGSQRMEE